MSFISDLVAIIWYARIFTLDEVKTCKQKWERKRRKEKKEHINIKYQIKYNASELLSSLDSNYSPMIQVDYINPEQPKINCT